MGRWADRRLVYFQTPARGLGLFSKRRNNRYAGGGKMEVPQKRVESLDLEALPRGLTNVGASQKLDG